MLNPSLRQLLSYLAPYRGSMFAGIGALFVVNMLGVYIPLLVRDSINQLDGSLELGRILGYVLAIAVLASLTWVIRMASRLAIFGVGRQVEFDLKQRLFQHILKFEPAYFFTNTIGDLMNRTTSDVDNIRRLVGFALLSLANTIFAYGLTLPFMLSLSVRLSLLVLLVYPLMLVMVQLFSGRLRDEQINVQNALSELSQMIQEDMGGISLIKIYAQEANERFGFQVKNRQLLRSNLALARSRNLLFPLIEGLVSLSLLLLLLVGSRTIESGEISTADFIALILYVERLVFPTALLGFAITTYQRGEVSIERVEAILQAEPRVQNVGDAIALPPELVQGRLTARQLNYTYPGQTKPALQDITFEIEPGETVAIVGPIGSGKSTLANALPRLLDIAPGQLFLDGHDITKIRLQDLREAIAYVPQDSFLFSATVNNNIRYGQPLAERPEIEQVAKQAQIHPEIINFPRQYETLVGERGITLSGGQRQRLSLARALLVSAPVVVLDDALSSVDNQTATAILADFAQAGDQTVIFISHQLAAAASADRIFVMHQGRLVQTGTHAALVQQEGLYQVLWQQQQLAQVLQ